VSEPRDEIDDWLEADVELLGPPPGTFGRVRQRARRRKAARALVSAAAAAVVVAGIAVGPRIAGSLNHPASGPSPSALASGRPHPASPRPRPTGSPSPSSAPVPPPASGIPATRSALGSPAAGAAVPAGFAPTSVTFVGPNLGAVIGQAGTPGECAGGADCTSLAGTDDYGRTWFGVSAPPAVAPDGADGVSQLRFLNASQGFAFGPGLWVTRNGGAKWSQVPLPSGTRVTDLETLDGEVFAVWAACTGTGADFAAHCTSFTLKSASVDGGSWHAVRGATGLGSGGASSSAALVLAGGATTDPASATGYLLAPDGTVRSGHLAGSGWASQGQADCRPGQPQAGTAQPAGALLTSQSGRLYLLCTGATAPGSGSGPVLHVSTNGGRTWQSLPGVPRLGSATSLAAASSGMVALATTRGIEISPDGGTSWQTAVSPVTGPAGGFRYVGMTDAEHGVAVPADAGLHQIWITLNGGRNWHASTIGGG
jgi:hypothetical protein